MRHLLTMVVAALLWCTTLNAQSTRTFIGGGGNTNWDNPANWSNGNMPALGDKVNIDYDGSITGFVPVNPGRVSVVAGRVVNLGVNITIEGNTITDHGLVVNDGASLTISNGILNISAGTAKDAITTFSSAGNQNIEITAGVTINISGGRRGIGIGSTTTTFSNAGTINIANMDDDGIRHVGTSFLNNGSIYINGVVTEAVESEALFENFGLIEISNSNISIRNKSTFKNSGTLRITNNSTTTGDGINSTAAFTNESTGVIEVSDTNTEGIENGSTFTNLGSLVLKGSKTSCLRNNSILNNSGSITITNPSGLGEDGIRNDGTFNNMSAGTINIANTTKEGIENNATFNNNGMITVSGADTYCIENDAVATFNNFGQITTNNPLGNAPEGIRNNGTFDNKAGATINTRDMTTTGIRSPGTFTNRGTINITNPSGIMPDGLRPDGPFTNMSSGVININGANNEGLQNESTFNNMGQINIVNAGVSGIRNVAPSMFTNGGTITVTSPSSVTTEGVRNEGTFINNMTINSQAGTEACIRNFDGTFTNNATINVTNPVGSVKDGIRNSSTFINGNAGTINISGANDEGLENEGTFTNNGTLICGSVGRDGILNQPTFTFTNNGTITITNASNTTVEGIQNDGTFTNASTISISNVTESSIRNNGTFTNSNMITLTNVAGVTTDGIKSEGPFTNTNTGTINATNMNDDGIEVLTTQFANDGTINVTMNNASGTSNNGIAVGSSSVIGKMTNTSNNSINIDGGTSPDARDLRIYSMGELNNTGTITVTNGNPDSRIYNEGTLTNANSATIDLTTDGRINNTDGTFTNDGIILSSRTSSAVFTSGGISTNNGYYEYGDAANFSSNSSTTPGTIIDAGIDLNAPLVDAMGNCSATVANTSYTYRFNGMLVGTSTSAGELSFPAGIFTGAGPYMLTIDEYPGKSILLDNVCALALPVDLVDFYAKMNDAHVGIKWTTASEVNHAAFELQRSQDGRSYTTIYTAIGLSDSHRLKEYKYEDYDYQSGINYYRLVQRDLDGSVTVSKTIAVESKTNDAEVAIFPTILQMGSPLTINGPAFCKISIYNSSGMIVFAEVMTDHHLSVPTSQLATGMHIVLIEGTNGEVVSQRVYIR